MRILLTGGNGFLGSHVAERLARDGHDLRLLLRPTSRLDFLAGVTYERCYGDLRDAGSLAKALDGIEAVVHSGALVSARTEREFMAVNAAGSASLAEAAATAGVRRFLYLSSQAAAGPSPDGKPRRLDEPLPISAYGRSKLAGEYAVLARKRRLNVAVLRLPVIYGPRDRALLPFYRVARLGVMPVIGDGLNRVSFLHAHDAAEAIAIAATGESASGRVYTVSDGESPHSWREVAQAFGDAIGKRALIVGTPPAVWEALGFAAGLASAVLRRPLPLNPDEARTMQQRYWVCDHERFTADFGWQPRIGIREGMKLSVQWYKQQGWL